MRRPLLSAVLAAACSLGVAGVAAADDGSTCSNLLGYPHVKNYDGSWTEWGNLVNAPIQKDYKG